MGGPHREVYPSDAGLGDVSVHHRPASESLRLLRERNLRPELVYINPPFAANQDFSLKIEVADGDPAVRVAYSDRWPGGLSGYLEFMDPVVVGIRDVLSPRGSLLLHCDHRAAPYLAVRCDELFGAGDRVAKHSAGFRNELVWSYGLGGSSRRCYPKKHDTILWYSKGEEWTFEPPLVPATSQRMKGQMKKAPDVLDIPTINNMAKERTGYPTQKPMALLDMFVAAHSRPGELVVDLFSGSGTTAAAASKLGRRAWVSDRGDDAIATARARLVAQGSPVTIERPEAVAELMGAAEGVSVLGDVVRLGEPAATRPLVFAASGGWTGDTFTATDTWCPDEAKGSSAAPLELRRSDAVLWRDVDGAERFILT